MPELKLKNFIVPRGRLADFCGKWKVLEFSLFGSVLREDFDPERSDVDVLVSFLPNAEWRLADFFRMEDELTEIFGHRVEMVNKQAVYENPNPLRRRRILETAQVINVGP